MTRRRLYYGLALGTLSLPACSALSPHSVMVPITPPGSLPPRTGFVPAPSAPVEEQFAAGRQVPVTPPIFKPLPTGSNKSGDEIETVQYRETAAEPTLIASPRIRPAAAAIAEPVADAEGIVRPHWPVIRGPHSRHEVSPFMAPVYQAPPVIKEPSALPPSVSRQEPAGPSAVITAPTLSAETVIGASAHEVKSAPVIDTPPPLIQPAAHKEATPVIPVPNHVKGPTSFVAPLFTKDETPVATPVVLPAPSDTPLIQAVRAFQQNNPQGALEHLKAYDPATQQVLISMMPVLVQLSEGKLQTMKREEMDILLDQLTRVPPMLRSRASFQTSKLLLCREVQKFGLVDAFPAGHEFRPGDMVYLYAELANFTCAADSRDGFAVALASHLELKDEAGNAVWKADPREAPERVSSPPQDYYRAYRFCVPSSLAPGKYALSIRVTDKPTGREAAKAVEFRVGAK